MPIFFACVLYLVLFVAWRNLQPEGILFYQGLGIAIVVAITQGGLQRRLLHDHPGKDALLTFLLCYSFMFTIPTTVDRAYSVRMLIELKSSNSGMSRDQLDEWFKTEFSQRGGIDKRLTEQQATGSVQQKDGHFTLTPLGHHLVTLFTLTQSVFNTAELDQY